MLYGEIHGFDSNCFFIKILLRSLIKYVPSHLFILLYIFACACSNSNTFFSLINVIDENISSILFKQKPGSKRTHQ